MTPENQTKDPKAAQKQKIIIGVIVVIVLIVLWQFISFSGNGSTKASAVPSMGSPMKPMTSSNTMQATPPGASTTVSNMAPAPAPEPVKPKQEAVAVNPEVLKVQQQTQVEYLSSLNKLQMLKLQREIDETKMAIATAELNRMTAEKNIADLITSKQEIAPQGPIMMPGTQSSTTTTTMVAARPVATPMPPPVTDLPYTVLSVAYVGRKWEAVVSLAGKQYSVNVGDTLSPDDSTVVAIDKKGVTLRMNNKTRTIALTNAM